MTCPVCYQVGTCEVSWCVTMSGARPADLARPVVHTLTCQHCATSDGYHQTTCPSYPKRGNRRCAECGWYNGHHHPTLCRGKGYAARGHHPSSPDRTPDTARATVPAGTRCECGVDKTGVGGMHSTWCPKAGAA